jgi:N-acetylglutamate synthase-like GNAT family acetyltransferase/mannose-6-phosphate isomerase-like protein (cupin superfamily)
MTNAPIRTSTPADDPRLRAFLEAVRLPATDVETGPQEYLLAEEDGRLVGSIGLEQVGNDALVRSLAVAPELRGQGLAARLDEAAVELARARGVKTLYLLTTTAEAYAARRGYERIPRTEVPEAVLALPQFRALCPATAVCMRRRLHAGAVHYPASALRLRPDVPGAAMWAVALERAMLTYYELQPHARFDAHQHEAEQITLVLEGELFFEVQGKEFRVGPGEVIALPSSVPHEAWTGERPARAVDAWSPPRRDLLG